MFAMFVVCSVMVAVLLPAVSLWVKADICDEDYYQNKNGSSNVNMTFECNATHLLVSVMVDPKLQSLLYTYTFGIRCFDLNNSEIENLVLADGVYLERFATVEYLELQYGWECVLFGCYTKIGVGQFSINPERCTIDKDECIQTHNCSKWAHCTNIIGSYECSCWQGYDGDGYTCTDIDECIRNATICGLNSVCTNLEGSYYCACQNGYTLLYDECVDINECKRNIDDCSAHSECYNYPGGYNCSCIAGFIGDGLNCTRSNNIMSRVVTTISVSLSVAVVCLLSCVSISVISGICSRKKPWQIIYNHAFMAEWQKQKLDRDYKPVDPKPSITSCSSFSSVLEALYLETDNQESDNIGQGEGCDINHSSLLSRSKANYNPLPQKQNRLPISSAPASLNNTLNSTQISLTKDESGFVSDTSSSHYLSFHELGLQYF